MRIVIFGANGRIGRSIVSESLRRGHDVTAAVRRPTELGISNAKLVALEAHIDDAESVAKTVTGHHCVVDAVGGLGHENERISIECMAPLTRGMKAAGVSRLLVVGTAGTLEVPEGGLRKDQPDFPERLKVEAEAHQEVLQYLSAIPIAELEWTYLSPPAILEPGFRSGNVLLGLNRLLFNGEGRSAISYEDFACVALDEIETPQHIGSRFTAISA